MKYQVINGTLTLDGTDYVQDSLVEIKDEAVASKLVEDGIVSAVEFTSQTPNKQWKVEDIKSWLTEKQVVFEETAKKNELLELVEKSLETKQ